MRVPVALRLGRVSNLPTVWTNVLAACALAGSKAAWPLTLQLCVAMSLFYVGGMYLNDAFDRRIDAIERPERPIPSGLVRARTVFVAGFGLLALGLLALIWVAASQATSNILPAALWGGATASVIVLYDAFHKQNPWSPVLMGLCRVGVYACTACAIAGNVAIPVWGGALSLFGYLIGLTYVAKQENLSRVRNLWPLVLIALPFLSAFAVIGQWPWGSMLCAGTAAWILYALSWLQRKPPQVRRVVVALIAGICLIDAIAMFGAGMPQGTWIAFSSFGLTLLLQRFIPGT